MQIKTHNFSEFNRHWSFSSFILVPQASPHGVTQESDAQLPFYPTLSVNSSLRVLATGRRSQQSSFIRSSIINEESKAPDDCDYLLGMDWSLQTCSGAEHHIHCKYEQ